MHPLVHALVELSAKHITPRAFSAGNEVIFHRWGRHDDSELGKFYQKMVFVEDSNMVLTIEPKLATKAGGG